MSDCMEDGVTAETENTGYLIDRYCFPSVFRLPWKKKNNSVLGEGSAASFLSSHVVLVGASNHSS